MTGRTHDLAAFTALNTVFLTQTTLTMSFSTAVVSLGACFLGGLTPDIDQPASEFWQKIPGGTYFGSLLHSFFGAHRHLSHSLLGLIVINFLIKYLLDLISGTLLVNMNLVWLAFMIGYVSHLIMDALTTQGIPFLFPLPFSFGLPPIKEFRIRTGGMIEKFIIFPGLLFFNSYFFYQYYPLYLNLLRSFLK